MSKLRVCVVFEFDDVEPGSPEDEMIVMNLTEETERMRVAFDASGCWVDDAEFISAADES